MRTAVPPSIFIRTWVQIVSVRVAASARHDEFRPNDIRHSYLIIMVNSGDIHKQIAEPSESKAEIDEENGTVVPKAGKDVEVVLISVYT